MFGFQKLDGYRCAVTFLGVASTLAERVPRGHSALADQLRQAALSVPLNIARMVSHARRLLVRVGRRLLECADLLVGRARLRVTHAA